MFRKLLQSVIALALFGTVLLSAPEVRGQYLDRWMQFSSFHNRFVETGMHNWYFDTIWWPGVRINHQAANTVSEAWIGAYNIPDVEGNPGPTVIEIQNLGLDVERFAPAQGGFQLVSKRPQPEVTVDGLTTFLRPAAIDQIDPDLPADRMIKTKVHTWHGITVEDRIYQFGSPYHEKYYIRHRTLTNTGVTPPEVGIKRDNTLDSVFVLQYNDYKPVFQGGVNEPQQRWGGNQTTDVIGDGDPDKQTGDLYPTQSDLDPYTPGHSNRPWVMTYTWSTMVPGKGFNHLGQPIMTDSHWLVRTGDSIGRLSSASMVAQARMHGDAEPHAPDEGWDASRDDPNQPYAINIEGGSSPECDYDTGWEGMYRRDAPGGRCYPMGRKAKDPISNYPGPDTLSWKEWQGLSIKEGAADESGFGYGPYQMEPGEEVDVVNMVAIAPLSRKAREEIGNQFKKFVRAEQDQFKKIGFDADGDGEITRNHTAQTANMPWEHQGEPYEYMNKQEWVMTTRDTAMTLTRRALAVTQGGYENFGYNGNLSEQPLPPRRFAVQSGVESINLSWELYSGASDPDEWIIYRNNNYWDRFQEIGRVSGSARSYEDGSAQRGVDYFYYLQAVNHDVSVATGGATLPTRADDGQQTVSVQSNKYYTLTFNPAKLLRAPPNNPMEAMRVVPNPFNFNQDENVRWPQQHQIGFLDIPGKCTIEIYTEVGEHVTTIEHTNGSGDEFWNLTTESNQVVAPGIYYAVITEHVDAIEGEQQAIRKFTIIR